MNEMRGWNSPVQDVDISEEERNRFASANMPYNHFGKYDANAYPEEYRMFLAKFGALL